jgi:putative oxidoreductase
MSDINLLVGRLLLVALYLVSATGKWDDLLGLAATLDGQGFPAPMVLAVIAATAELGGALAVALGFRTRSAALGLIAYTVLATLTFHAFWQLQAPEAQAQSIQFLKNLGLIGGFLLLSAVGPGAYGLDSWQHRQSVSKVPAR